MATVRVCDLCGGVIDGEEYNSQTFKVKRKRHIHETRRGRDVTGKKIVYEDYTQCDMFFHKIDCHIKCVEKLFEAANATRKARAACADTKFDDAYTEWKKMADKVMDLEK